MKRLFIHLSARFYQARSHRAFRRYRKLADKAYNQYLKMDGLQ
jgi:hypothetical protein